MSNKLQTFARHPGLFSLTVDGGNSGNNYDFLAVTLHYFDVSFRLVDVAIGFEVLKKNISYTGEALFKSLDDVLTQYDIKSRIISITRDNGGPMNALLDLFAKERNKNVGENDLGFSGDSRCVGHVFNLVTEAFLSFTFFKTKKTKKFETILQQAQEDHPTLCESLPKLRSSPGVIRSILNGIHEIGPIKNLYLATVLDPRLKIAALQDCGISDSAITNVEEYFHEVYSVYKANIDEKNTRPELVGARRIGQSASRVGSTNDDLLGNLLARRNRPESSSDEVKRYLFEEQQDTIFDFYAARRNTFPVISQMARDFLAIPAMSASSERIFSKVGDMVTRKRNRLQPGTIKMLAILKARDLVVDEESTVCDVAEGAKSTSDNIIDKENEKQDEDGELEAITIEDSDTSEDDDEALVTVFIPEN
ncbi:hypothetical protein OXX59_005418 [Metschnikowia pulcherrima]